MGGLIPWMPMKGLVQIPPLRRALKGDRRGLKGPLKGDKGELRGRSA
jgi:hypothetical protein